MEGKENRLVKMKYKCGWCKCEFTSHVFYDPDSKISSQVRCPRCLNLIPTWKREETGEVVGKKHIHIRR